jgi:predicted DsbA family dithiol-disulfide isomerase
MTKLNLITLFFLALTFTNCKGQTNKNNQEMRNETIKNNPLLCDPETGVCEIPSSQQSANNEEMIMGQKPVKIIYYTDPICSSCWGIEPQLRKLKLEYGNEIDIEYRMGGLLPDWNYNSGGINEPADVAHHWDEVSAHYQMPIDGDVWLEDPLNSSYPPSIAFKAAQMQDATKSLVFLRIIKEMVFLEKKNIAKWENIKSAATQAGLDAIQLQQDYDNKAKELFQADLDLGRKLGVRGFPTLFVSDGLGNQEVVYGVKPYEVFETAIAKVYPKVEKVVYEKNGAYLFQKFPTLTTKEFAVLTDLSFSESEVLLEKLVQQNKLIKVDTKNGAIWKRKDA